MNEWDVLRIILIVTVIWGLAAYVGYKLGYRKKGVGNEMGVS